MPAGANHDAASAMAWARSVRLVLPFLTLDTLLRLQEAVPAMRRISPSALRRRLEERASVLQTDLVGGARALPGYPHLITADPGTIAGKMRALAEGLGIGFNEAVTLALGYPPLFSLRSAVSLDRIRKNAALLGLTVRELKALAVSRDMRLILALPATLAARFAALTTLYGLDEKSVRALVTRQPTLLHVTPAKLTANLGALAALLGIDRARAVSLARHHPQILYQDTETMSRNLEGIASALGIPFPKVIVAARRQTQLLFQNPKSVRARIGYSAHRLGIPQETFCAAACRSPALFTARPETIHGNMLEVSRLLSIDPVDTLAIMMRQPQLLMARPQTLIAKARLLVELAEYVDGHAADVVLLLRKHAMALTFSTERLQEAVIYAHANPTLSLGSILKRKTA